MGYKMRIPYNSRLHPKPFVDNPGLQISLFRLIRHALVGWRTAGDSGWTGWPGRWNKPPQHRGRGVGGGGVALIHYFKLNTPLFMFVFELCTKNTVIP